MKFEVLYSGLFLPSAYAATSGVAKGRMTSPMTIRMRDIHAYVYVLFK